jgi:SAM-dependent methyltransferase
MKELRTIEQLREHYEIEKELASRLRNAAQCERRILYSVLYNEMYQRLPLHPQLIQKSSPEQASAVTSAQMKLLHRFLKKDAIFLEVGSGDCELSLEVARYVKQVYAVDVSDEITRSLTPPQNFRLIISDGCSISMPEHSVNVAYSNQLMEHLHPDDALEQLRNIVDALGSDGVYICITPNSLNGPHDISKYFDEVATGFHLKEYTVSELSALFKKTGFSKVEVIIGARGIYVTVPLFPLILFERLLGALPYRLRLRIARSLPTRLLLGINLVGTK